MTKFLSLNNKHVPEPTSLVENTTGIREDWKLSKIFIFHRRTPAKSTVQFLSFIRIVVNAVPQEMAGNTSLFMRRNSMQGIGVVLVNFHLSGSCSD